MQVRLITYILFLNLLLFSSCDVNLIENNKKKFSIDVMRTITLAIESYHLEKGKLPQKLSDMVPIYCQPGKNGFKDGWGRILSYDSSSGTVISCGSDGVFNTKDDLYIKQDGTNNF